MVGLETLSGLQTGLIVAFGAGLLIGVERERRKGQGPDRHSAGLRTFLVAALAGAAGQAVSALVAAVVLAAVATMAGLSYWRSSSDDPGLTTELALVTTALIGMLAVSQPEVAAALAVVLASALAMKERLHRFATDWLSEVELHDGLLLAALALVLLPLLPVAPIEWLGHLSPRRILMLVVVILSMQAASHLGQRLLGARSGVAVSGLIGGFVSSTATISALGSDLKAGRLTLRAALCGGVLSSSATWLQVLLIGLVLSPGQLRVILVPMLVGAAVPLLLGGGLWWSQSARVTSPRDALAGEQRVLRPTEALKVCALLLSGAVLVQWADQAMPQGGVLLGVGIAAVADAHAPMAALLSMHHAGHIDTQALLQGLLLAIAVNSVTRTSAAALSGGSRYAAGMAVVFGLSLATVGAWSLLLQA